MALDFQPKAKSRYDKVVEFLNLHRQKIAVAAVFVLMIFLVSNQISMTGKVASAQAMESELNETKAALAEINSTSGECTNNLIGCATNLSACESDTESVMKRVSNLTNELEQTRLKLNKSESLAGETGASLLACRSVLNASQTDYKELVRNSVKDVCCTVNDATSGTIKNWVVLNNRILCNQGSLIVNCSGGQINY